MARGLILNMDKELIILEQIQNNPHVNQRDLATITRASLGMTNAILKRFVEKGLITIKKVNNRNIRYALTSEGMEEINRRSWGYFKRTIKNVVDYQDAIRAVVRQAVADGYEGVVLLGESDLEFIIEHTCHKESIDYMYASQVDFEVSDSWFVFYAETEEAMNPQVVESGNSFSLNRLFIH